jgi:hypothetical protein
VLSNLILLIGSVIEAGLKLKAPETSRPFTSLYLHTRKLGQYGLSSWADILTEKDEIFVDFGGLVPNPEFLLTEFDDITGKKVK